MTAWLKDARAVIAQMRADMEAAPVNNNAEYWLPWCRHMEALADEELLAWRRSDNPDVDLFTPGHRFAEFEEHDMTAGRA